MFTNFIALFYNINDVKHIYMFDNNNGREQELIFLKYSTLYKKYKNIKTTQRPEQIYD